MRRGRSLVTAKDRNQCFTRISEAKDLYEKLQTIGADIRQIAYLIALARHQNYQRKNILDERAIKKTRIDDGLKKIEKRHPQLASLEPLSKKKFKVLKSYVTQLARKASFADSRSIYLDFHIDVKKGVRSPTKKLPTLGLYICCLEAVLQPHTQSPYRYIAGLFNAFNLRPEAACSACLQFDKKAKKCKNLSNIFGRDCHNTTRRALWQIADKIKKMYPPGLIERLKESTSTK